MGWPASLTVAGLTGMTTGLMAGVIANLAVGWYRMSSFEGASGYFVVGMALVGAIVGAIVGVAISRALGDSSFLRALGLAQLAVIVPLVIVGTVARLRADVPPRLGGQELLLAVEFRFPEGVARPTPDGSAEWFVRLGALSGDVMRASARGPLWPEDARFEGGRWVVPGAVDLFTGRGKRLLSVEPGSVIGEGFLVPVGSRPGSGQLEWSDWLPTTRAGGVSPTARVQYRFRLVPADRPARVEQVGRFEIASIGNGYAVQTDEPGSERWFSDARFEVRHDGTPVSVTDGDSTVTRFDAVLVVGGPVPAVVVQVDGDNDHGGAFLITSRDTGFKAEQVAEGGASSFAMPIPESSPHLDQTYDRAPLPGRVDRATLHDPGLFLLRDAVLDTRTLTVRRFAEAGLGDIIGRIPPLGAAPDGVSFVRLAWAGGGDGGERTALLVIDLDGGVPYTVEVDRRRMRYAAIEQIDPAWLAHYFAWQRQPSGRDRLVERSGILPLAHRGMLTTDQSGYREYRLAPALAGLRAAVEKFLVTELGAVAGATDDDAFSHELRVGDAVVNVSFRHEDGTVTLWMDRGGDTMLVATIADRFNAALATGRYDQWFGE